MGGPWRERGFDPESLRAPRPRREPRAEALRRDAQGDVTRLVVAYVVAVAASFGLMLTLMQHGW